MARHHSSSSPAWVRRINAFCSTLGVAVNELTLAQKMVWLCEVPEHGRLSFSSLALARQALREFGNGTEELYETRLLSALERELRRHQNVSPRLGPPPPMPLDVFSRVNETISFERRPFYEYVGTALSIAWLTGLHEDVVVRLRNNAIQVLGDRVIIDVIHNEKLIARHEILRNGAWPASSVYGALLMWHTWAVSRQAYLLALARKDGYLDGRVHVPANIVRKGLRETLAALGFRERYTVGSIRRAFLLRACESGDLKQLLAASGPAQRDRLYWSRNAEPDWSLAKNLF